MPLPDGRGPTDNYRARKRTGLRHLCQRPALKALSRPKTNGASLRLRSQPRNTTVWRSYFSLRQCNLIAQEFLKVKFQRGQIDQYREMLGAVCLYRIADMPNRQVVRITIWIPVKGGTRPCPGKPVMTVWPRSARSARRRDRPTAEECRAGAPRPS